MSSVAYVIGRYTAATRASWADDWISDDKERRQMPKEGIGAGKSDGGRRGNNE